MTLRLIINKQKHRKVSDEQILKQQFKDLLLELNQDAEVKHFKWQEKLITLIEERIFSTSCKSNIWVLPLHYIHNRKLIILEQNQHPILKSTS